MVWRLGPSLSISSLDFLDSCLAGFLHVAVPLPCRCRVVAITFVPVHVQHSHDRARGGSRRGTEATFGVVHFAGEVIYDATEFVEKNRDEVPTALHDLVLSSNDRFVFGRWFAGGLGDPFMEIRCNWW